MRLGGDDGWVVSLMLDVSKMSFDICNRFVFREDDKACLPPNPVHKFAVVDADSASGARTGRT